MGNSIPANRRAATSRSSHAIYRVLCLSRNLTFDQSWDTILRLDGEVTGTSHQSEGIAYFVDQLPKLVLREIAKDRTDAIKQLATELRQVTFTPPEGFDRVAFWPLGFGRDDWPFHDRIDRIAVISPF